MLFVCCPDVLPPGPTIRGETERVETLSADQLTSENKVCVSEGNLWRCQVGQTGPEPRVIPVILT